MTLDNDCGIVIAVNNYKEEGLIVKILTRNYGLISCFSKKISKKQKPIIQIGNLLNLNFWLKSCQQFAISQKYELEKAFGSLLIFEPQKIKILYDFQKIISKTLPEGEINCNIFDESCKMLEQITINSSVDGCCRIFIDWQVFLLGELGFALDLSRCAVTNSQENLHYISPKTGRAVSFEAGKQYHDKLFLIPKFFIDKNLPSENIANSEITNALNITNFFFSKIEKANRS